MGRLDADDRGTASPSAAAVEGRARPAVDGGAVACDAQGDPPLLRDERYGKIRRGGLLDAQGDPPLLGQPSSAGLVGAPPVSLAQPASSSQSGARARARIARASVITPTRAGTARRMPGSSFARNIALIASYCVSLRFIAFYTNARRDGEVDALEFHVFTTGDVLLRLIASYCVLLRSI